MNAKNTEAFLRIIAALMCICVALTSVSCTHSVHEDTASLGQTDQNSVQNGDLSFPPIWASKVRKPYVVAEVNKITDITADIADNYAKKHVKLECSIKYAYNTEIFLEEDRFEPWVTVAKLETGADADIYVTEKSAKLLKTGDVIFFKVNAVGITDSGSTEGQVYYSPFTDTDGYSQYVEIIDGKVSMGEKDLPSCGLEEIRDLNDNISAIAGYRESVSPLDTFGEGLTIDGIREYFQAWEKAYMAWASEYLELMNPWTQDEPTTPAWVMAICWSNPYAVAEIRSITGETVQLGDDKPDTFVRVECSMKYLRFIGTLGDLGYYGIGADIESTLGDKITEIYVDEKTAAQLVGVSGVFFKIRSYEKDGQYCYGPRIENGVSFCIPMIDGKLAIGGKALDRIGFEEIGTLNDNIDQVTAYCEHMGEKTTTNTVFGDGMTVDDIIEYFQAWEETYQAWRDSIDGQTSRCIDSVLY